MLYNNHLNQLPGDATAGSISIPFVYWIAADSNNYSFPDDIDLSGTGIIFSPDYLFLGVVSPSPQHCLMGR
jgi:hypothetical protein